MSLFHKKEKEYAEDVTAMEPTAASDDSNMPKSVKEMSPELKKSYKKICWVDRFITFIVFMVVAVLLASNFMIAIVPSPSMYPTLAIKEFLLIRKVDAEDIQRGDICVFYHHSAGEKIVFCKRMIALPGDTVEIKNNVLYLNGEAQEETYCPENMLTPDMPAIVLGEDEYFLMGDNRNDSVDCRVFGPVQEEDLIGYTIFHSQFFNDPNLDGFYQNLPNNINSAFIDPKLDHPRVIKH